MAARTKTALLVRWLGGTQWQYVAHDPETGAVLDEVWVPRPSSSPGSTKVGRATLAARIAGRGYRLASRISPYRDVARLLEASGGSARV